MGCKFGKMGLKTCFFLFFWKVPSSAPLVVNKMDLREVDCDSRDWINLAEDREQWRAYVRAVMKHRVP